MKTKLIILIIILLVGFVFWQVEAPENKSQTVAAPEEVTVKNN